MMTLGKSDDCGHGRLPVRIHRGHPDTILSQLPVSENLPSLRRRLLPALFRRGECEPSVTWAWRGADLFLSVPVSAWRSVPPVGGVGARCASARPSHHERSTTPPRRDNCAPADGYAGQSSRPAGALSSPGVRGSESTWVVCGIASAGLSCRGKSGGRSFLGQTLRWNDRANLEQLFARCGQTSQRSIWRNAWASIRRPASRSRSATRCSSFVASAASPHGRSTSSTAKFLIERGSA